MASCIIFGAADFTRLIEPVTPEDYIIAADGGLRHTQALGLTPQEILGDFDSLGYIPQGATVYPVEKDDTDTMLAVKRGLALGYRRFLLYGGMGGRRLDHTMANFQALAYLATHNALGFLVGSDTLAAAIHRGTVAFPAGMAGDFSAFCLGSPARDVSIRGLYYQAEHITLTADFPLAVSNHFTGQPAQVETQDGTLLLLWQRQSPLPGWN